MGNEKNKLEFLTLEIGATKRKCKYSHSLSFVVTLKDSSGTIIRTFIIPQTTDGFGKLDFWCLPILLEINTVQVRFLQDIPLKEIKIVSIKDFNILNLIKGKSTEVYHVYPVTEDCLININREFWLKEKDNKSYILNNAVFS